ncbi:MAG: toll/interleukin-1 receptor domain-containing protein [Blastocatellia bacterium]
MSKIFISYRREDTAGYAISLHDRLADRFGADHIFIDIDSIEPGEDFVEVLNEKVGACEVLVALIGRDWLTCQDESGQRRLDNHDDFVRLEVAAALERKIRVIPVLVGGAKLPKPDQLCVELAPLCHRNAIALTDAGFRQDVNRLIESIEKAIKGSGISARKAPTSQDSTPAASAAPGSTRAGGVPSKPSRKRTGAGASSGQSAQKTKTEKFKFGKERIFRGHGKPVKTVAFSPDSQILASAGGGSWLGGGDTAIRLWRVSDGRQLRELTGHKDTVYNLAFSPDGKQLASCCSAAIHLWRTSEGKRLRTLEYSTGGCRSLAYSSDGSKLACWKDGEPDDQKSLYEIWSVSNGKFLDSYSRKRPPKDFRWERVSPDGRMVASDELIRIEEYEYQAIVVKRVADGATLLELKDEDGSGATDWKFSTDGRLLAASYLNNAIRVWRLPDGERLTKIQLPGTPNSVAISPDGQWLAAGCEDKLVRVWPLSQSQSK